jgi:CheY-like chemotaxis protein
MPTVLFADDSITIRKVAERHLADAGLDLVFVGSGEEALAWLERGRADLVVTDVIMPDRSGYDICAYVRSQPRLMKTGVLLITGIVDEEVLRRANDCGADGVVKKPFHGTTLRDRVREVLTGRREQGEAPAPAEPATPPQPAVPDASPAAPPPPKVYRITEEQLQAFRQAAARIRALEQALAEEQARTVELEKQVRGLASDLETERARTANAGILDAAAARVLEEARAEVVSLRERLAEAERLLVRLRRRDRELSGRLAGIARLAALPEAVAAPDQPDPAGPPDSPS